MGMSVGGSRRKGRVQPEMNVTPLVDVVLVLLIIFMILAPIITEAFVVRLPPKDDKQEELEQVNDPSQPLVLTVTDEGAYEVNGVVIEPEELSVRLHRMLNTRPDNVLYLDGKDDASVGAVLRGVDMARQGGASPVVFLTKTLE